ncbi:MAG: site-specific integrase [Clostridia bacterium]|nr:site-specific integrase [Clostridia bacterium]
MKLNEWLDIWLNKYTKHTIKIRTFERYKYLIEKHINPFLGHLSLDDLSINILQDFVIMKIEKGNLKTGEKLANNTIVGICRILKQAILEANKFGYTNTNNTNLIKLPPITQKEVTAFERHEQEKIEKYCLSKKVNYLGIVICLYSGIRIGELLALTYDDIDFEKNLMHINKTTYQTKKDGKIVQVIDVPKTKNSIRIIPLPKTIIKFIKRNKKLTNSKYIITTKSKGIVSTRSYERTFELILKKLDIPYKNFHSLRHTFATRATEMGIDARTLSEILGHKNPIITLNRYTHSLLSYKTNMINKLGKNLEIN